MIDTAGIRETDDPVEQEGVRRARARAADADLVLWMTDAEQEDGVHVGTAPRWVVRNKIDLDTGPADSRRVTEPAGASGREAGGVDFLISASRGDGIAALVAALVSFAQDYFGAVDGGLIGRTRQRELLRQTAASLHRSIAAIGAGEELAAEDLRAAAYALGRLLGRVDVEDILDVIFRQFCIGK
jgi:tRNA modification GTPase